MTEIVFILDRSGSMAGLESDTIGGFNSMIKKQQEETDDAAFVTTILFNDESKFLLDRIPLAEVKPLTKKDYQVGGTTALLDAVGDAINHVKNIHKYARAEDVPQKTIVIITTDGEENDSQKFTYKQVKKLIGEQKEKGWEFVFLGANIDAAEVAESIGIDADNAVDYHADKVGTRKAYYAMNKFVASYRKMESRPNRNWREELDEDFKNRKK